MKSSKIKKFKYTIYLILGIILFISGLLVINYLAWLGWVLIIVGGLFIFVKMFKIRKINLFLKKKKAEIAAKK